MMTDESKYERPIGVKFKSWDEKAFFGQLRIQQRGLRDSNVVHIFDEGVLFIRGDDLHGISEAGKVSLLEYIGGGPLSMTSWEDFTMSHGDVAFRYAVVGKRHIAADEQCIRGISFCLEGIDTSVFAHDKFQNFGRVLDPDDELLGMLEEKVAEENEKMGMELGEFDGDYSPVPPSRHFIKGKATISYFTGNFEFLPDFDTVLGSVCVTRTMREDLFGQKVGRQAGCRD